jgi:hypothetical protein
LYWNGAALGMAGSAGGWTDGGANVYTTTSTDKVGIGTATPEFKLSLDTDGGILAKGTMGSGTQLATSGAGTRLIWSPEMAAFRAGYVDGSQWDRSHIGTQSVGLGHNTTAFGISSTAMGEGTTASGMYSTAMGNSSTASGSSSTAMGEGTTASADYSLAAGYSTTASNGSSTAMGTLTTASGSCSTAMGAHTKAESEYGMAVGCFNVGGGTAVSWVDTDPIFEIGNGANDLNRANALTVLKNGKVGINTSTPEFELSLGNNGGILAKATHWSGSTLSTSGAGTRLIWYPARASFRAGYVEADQWDNAHIGDNSVAMGYNSTASGEESTALGGGTTASGGWSTALNHQTIAFGEYSTAIGNNTIVQSYAAVAIGRYNVGGGTNNGWVAADPLFEIGNGADASNKANALTVLKNGMVGIGPSSPSSTLDVAGDIETGGANALYFGDPSTNGSWRIIRSGTDLVCQRRVSGSWVTKITIPN